MGKLYVDAAFLLAFLIYAAHAPTAAYGDVREELDSFLQAQGTNWLPLKQFDVLVRTDEIREPAIVAGFTRTTYERLIFDWDANRFVYAKTSVKESLGDRPYKQSIETGFIVKEGKFRTFDTPERHLPPREVQDFRVVFDNHTVPDFRVLLFMKLGWGSTRTWTEDMANLIDVYPRTATDVSAIAQEGENVVLQAFFDNDSGFRWSFSKDSLMPVEVQWRRRSPQNTETTILGRDEIVWESHKGIFLPEKVVGEYLDRQGRLPPDDLIKQVEQIDGENRAEKIRAFLKENFMDVMVQRDQRFHWVSVNQPLTESVFDFSMIDQADEFRKLLDPNEAGASGLSDKSE
ncbi:hypothetical protein Pla52n_67910 [Stieleria varia]|uniref:DUF4340 domain-containing protein n=2 Tax=Stieleria varia TaxID=2528005 RepID=A0A5C5ZPK7_9BACT|nr:hypothetical protein Pla52n_67910 [Stieleria varia]